MEKDTREEYYKKMFDKLKDHIGEEVIIQTRWTNGDLSKEIFGILNEVKNFERIVVDNTTFPLYSLASMVYKVAAANKNKLLYINPSIIEQDTLWTHEQIEYMQRDAFGDRIANKNRERRVLKEAKELKSMKLEEKGITSAKEDLRELGLIFIEKTMKNSWNKYLDEHCTTLLEIEDTKIALEIIRKLNEEITYDEIFYTIIEQKYNLDSLFDSKRILSISSIVDEFCQTGKNFHTYCQEVCNFEREVNFKPTVKM